MTSKFLYDFFYPLYTFLNTFLVYPETNGNDTVNTTYRDLAFGLIALSSIIVVVSCFTMRHRKKIPITMNKTIKEINELNNQQTSNLNLESKTNGTINTASIQQQQQQQHQEEQKWATPSKPSLTSHFIPTSQHLIPKCIPSSPRLLQLMQSPQLKQMLLSKPSTSTPRTPRLNNNQKKQRASSFNFKSLSTPSASPSSSPPTIPNLRAATVQTRRSIASDPPPFLHDEFETDERQKVHLKNVHEQINKLSKANLRDQLYKLVVENNKAKSLKEEIMLYYKTKNTKWSKLFDEIEQDIIKNLPKSCPCIRNCTKCLCKPINWMCGCMGCLLNCCSFCILFFVIIPLIVISIWKVLDQDAMFLKKCLREIEITLSDDSIFKNIFETDVNVMRPGERYAFMNRTVHHPVVFIPGIISSGLEVWQGEQCARSNHFRKRIWGSTDMFSVMTPWNANCWLRHMKLNETNWQDPDGIRIRPSQGLSSADIFVPGLRLWIDIYESLSDVGYTIQNMHMASYDWRLKYEDLENRDSFFSGLKSKVELLYNTNHQIKIVVISHSMGTPVWLHYMQWISKIDSKWIDTYISTWSNVAGSLLGTAKALSAALSAEMRDTAEMSSIKKWSRQLISRDELISTFHSWGSVPALFPRGGHAIWGHPATARGRMITFNVTMHHALLLEEKKDQFMLDDGDGDGVVNVNESNVYNLSDTNGDGKVTWKEVQTYDINLSNQQRKEALLDWEQSEDDVNLFNKVMNKFNTFQQQDTTLKTTCPVTNNITHLGTDAILDLLRTLSPEYMKLVDEFYSFDIVATPLAAGRSSSKHWSNPLATALPLAPNMAIVCMYGVNKPTERAYVYRERGVGKECRGERNGVEIDDDVNVGKFGNGVRCDWSGDGTIPLESLGYLCRSKKYWNSKSSTPHNPSGIVVVTKEYDHQKNIQMKTDFSLSFGHNLKDGKKSGDHVQILGNEDLISDLLNIVTSIGTKGIPKNMIHSRLDELIVEIDEEN